jgi:hypothetical protein
LLHYSPSKYFNYPEWNPNFNEALKISVKKQDRGAKNGGVAWNKMWARWGYRIIIARHSRRYFRRLRMMKAVVATTTMPTTMIMPM